MATYGPYGSKPPSPQELISKVMSSPVSPKSRAKAFRSRGLLAGGVPLVPAGIIERDPYNQWEIAEIFDDESWEFFKDFPSDPSGYGYNNEADTPVAPDEYGNEPTLTGLSTTSTAPAPISEMPTSSIRPEKPRTVAAGYDAKRRCLTVIFRDGTFYNYYEVSTLEWGNFKRAHSKGRFILTYLDNKPRGIANMVGATTSQQHSEGYVEALYRIARTAQIKSGGITGKQKRSSARRIREWHKTSYHRKRYLRPF